MPPPTPSELKKALLARGFEIYRTTADEVVLADRVRDNLLMDSFVAARTGAALAVRVAIRAEASSFPGEGAEELFVRARRLAAAAEGLGYRETAARTVPILDPGDKSHVLDTWCEVWFERPVEDVEELARELRTALSLEKCAVASR